MTGRAAWAAVLLAAAIGCASPQETNQMQDLAEQYVKLVLAVGQHDPDYVDAFYGPKAWRDAAVKRPLAEIDADAASLAARLTAAAPINSNDQLVLLRYRYLTRQLDALRTRVAMLGGRTLTFDEESKALYDAVAPHHSDTEFEGVLTQLEALLPGPGALLDRYTKFRDAYVIPPARLDATFKAAIDACRRKTLEHVRMPDGESFTVEYVTNKSWAGYNWYQGNYRSLIQVNTDLPIFADRAIDLACHEGYPGHHVYNVLLEKNLVRDRGWPEFQVYPLFSPQSLIAEGTANYGIDVAFPPAERLKLEREVIFPAAGLDPGGAERYYAVMGLVDRLSYAGNEAARRYIDGQIDAAAASAWLERYGLYSPARATQRMRFVDQYRSYVINYNLGKDMVAHHIDARSDGDPAKRWTAFTELLSSPRLPSGLVAAASAGR
ncbi:MAG TPA: hypothetical protein VFO31_15660 [Vicinamibacterales bacterium]|nr:hypothetical protein [Vicinamibacterales bacterium]